MERICSYLAQRRGPEAVPHEVSRCWQNSRRLAQACMKDGQGTEGFPDHEEAKQLLTALREETSRLGKEGSAARFTKYRDKLNERADASRRCLTTICAGRAEPSGVLRKGAGVTANVDEMDEVLNTAWDPILRKYKDGPEPEYEPFRDRFRDHIGPHMMEAGTITGEELRILLRKKPKKSASGVDGWRMAELRELPLPLLNALADLLNLVEATGDWPASMTTALVSMVPKDESQDPLHTRPITVTSAVPLMGLPQAGGHSSVARGMDRRRTERLSIGSPGGLAVGLQALKPQAWTTLDGKERAVVYGELARRYAVAKGAQGHETEAHLKTLGIVLGAIGEMETAFDADEALRKVAEAVLRRLEVVRIGQTAGWQEAEAAATAWEEDEAPDFLKKGLAAAEKMRRKKEKAKQGGNAFQKAKSSRGGEGRK
ncbi:hypothetical protein DIPPA_29916 [Diplonema papillatum]|nr:hypothetical protein DIPPA_29916 [Diplonema papillatum]